MDTYEVLKELKLIANSELDKLKSTSNEVEELAKEEIICKFLAKINYFMLAEIE